MGLLDKVKTQATQLAEKAQEAGKAGQAKLESLQTKKQSDTLLRDLGAYTFAKTKGRGDTETDTKIAGVIAQLDAFEAQHGVIDLSPDPGTTATTDAAGGMAPPVANVPQSTVVGGATDTVAAPAYQAPAANIGGVPSGNVGGVPSGNVGGVPGAEAGDTSGS